ncbi:aminoglycoside phosphotransferase family protein [Nocardiopsis sp. ARC36]
MNDEGTSLFVKVYPDSTDLGAERRAIELTQRAGEHGVPTALPRVSVGGETLTRVGSTVLSVWEWVHGHTESGGFSPTQHTVVGRALGRIHTVFAHHQLSGTASPWVQDWYEPGLDSVRERARALLELIGGRDQHEEFDSLAHTTLNERLGMLAEVPDLLAGVPRDLNTQVLHGDFTAPNLLFDGDDLAAVVDFRPPVPYMLAFELGRIAFDPRTVALDERWIDSAARLVAAYLDANPAVARRDVFACGRVTLIQMLRSLYGVEQHYLAPDPDQQGLDRFWELRQQAAERLLRNLGEVESMLGGVCSTR